MIEVVVVEERTDEPMSTGESGFEQNFEVQWHGEAIPTHLRVALDLGDGVECWLHGVQRTKRYYGPEARTWRDPWTFEILNIDVRHAEELPLGPSVFDGLRMGRLYAAAERHFKDRTRVDPTMWGGLPRRPGRNGHPIEYYADWTRRYLEAFGRVGQKCVKDLVAQDPNYDARFIQRTIDKADQLGLISDRPGRGKAGGTMTDRCREVLAMSSEVAE